MTVSTDKEKKKKKPKKQGPIRWSAVVPAIVLSVAIGLYGKYALDGHMRKLLIWSAEKVHGAEVNLSSLKLSLLKGQLSLKGLQVTNKEQPTHNLVAIENIIFHLNTYELLKAKFIVETSEVTGIQWASLRKKPGKVYPKEKDDSLKKVEEVTLSVAQENLEGSALGNVANVLAGSDSKSEIKDITAELTTEKKIKELEQDLKGKEEFYKNKIDELKSLDELKKVKTSVKSYKWNKKDPIGSLKKLNNLIKTTKNTAKKYERDIKTLKTDIKKIENVSSNIDKWIEEDMEKLQSKAGIPELDPEKLAFSLFGSYFGDNVAKFKKYSEVAKEYMPPPKDQRKQNTLVPPKRGEGKTYRFPKRGENPKVWVKKVKISSKADGSEFGGNLTGEITDITTSPAIINKPVKLSIMGDFPKQRITGLNLWGTLDHRTDTPKQDLTVDVASFPFKERSLSKSEDLSLKLSESMGKLTFKAQKEGEQAQVNLSAKTPDPKFEVDAKKKLVKEIVASSLGRMNSLTLEGQAKGAWESLSWKFRSNIGNELAQGFKKELGLRVEQKKKELKEKLMAKIGPQKKKYEDQVNKVKSQLNQSLDQQKDKVDGEVKGLLADLKGQQKGSVDEGQKKLEKKAKKLLKKLF